MTANGLATNVARNTSPIFVATAIDFEMVNGKRHGDLAIPSRIAHEIILRRWSELHKSPEETRRHELEGGIDTVGRHSFNYLMAELKRSWTDGLEKVDREELLVRGLEADRHFDQPDDPPQLLPPIITKLSTGICTRLHTARPDDEELFNGEHAIQFLFIKKVTPGPTSTNPTDRYRMILSDGEHYVQAILATQLNPLVEDQLIVRNTVAVIEKLACHYVQDKRMWIILGLRVVTTNESKIGNPTSFEQSDSLEETNHQNHANSVPASSSNAHVQQQQQQQPAQQRPQTPMSRTSISPIEGLSPYQNNWTIKARVTQKSEIRTWSNQRGKGKLFKVNLMDESGEIKATGFNNVVDELYDKFQEGKVYYISKARVNLANKKFSNLPNDYELSLELHTEIEECLDTSNIPMLNFSFVSLSNLEGLVKDSTCDVLGVVKEIGPVIELILKTGRTIPKRDLTLVDKSGFSVRLTIWGKQAEQFTCEDHAIVAFKGVRVDDFGGRSLSVVNFSTMTVNPEHEDAYALRDWYDAIGAQQTFQSHSNSLSFWFSGGSFNRAGIRNLEDVKDSQLGMSDKVEFFSARATIMHIKTDNISYPACPTQGCNKKVIQLGEKWRCERCDRSFESPEHRYIVSLAVADWSGQAWLQGFNDAGLAVFGMPANDLVSIKQNNEAQFNVFMHKARCGTFNFACRAKQDTYNDQTRVRYGISRIIPIDYREEASAMSDLLSSSWAW